MAKRIQREFGVDAPVKCYKTKYDASFKRNFCCLYFDDYNHPEFLIIDENGKLVSFSNTNDPWKRTIIDTNNIFSNFTENIWKYLIKYLDLESLFNLKNTCSLFNLIINYMLGLLQDEENDRELFIEALDWGESWNIFKKNNSDTYREFYFNDVYSPTRMNVQFVPIHIHFDVAFVAVFRAFEGAIALDNNGNLWNIENDSYSNFDGTFKYIENTSIVLQNIITIEELSLNWGNCTVIINKSGEIFLHGYWFEWDEFRFFKKINCGSPYFHVLSVSCCVIFYDDDANFYSIGVPQPYLTNFIQEKKQFLPIQSFAYCRDAVLTKKYHDYLYPECTLLLDSSNSLWQHNKKGEWHNIKFDHLIHSVVWLPSFWGIFILGHCGNLWKFVDGNEINHCADNIHNIFTNDYKMLVITIQGSLYQYNNLHQLEYQYPFFKPLTNFPASISSKSARK